MFKPISVIFAQHSATCRSISSFQPPLTRLTDPLTRCSDNQEAALHADPAYMLHALTYYTLTRNYLTYIGFFGGPIH